MPTRNVRQILASMSRQFEQLRTISDDLAGGDGDTREEIETLNSQYSKDYYDLLVHLTGGRPWDAFRIKLEDTPLEESFRKRLMETVTPFVEKEQATDGQ